MKNSVKRIRTILTALMYVGIYYAVSGILQLIYIMWQSGIGTISVSRIEENLTNGAYALMVIAAIVSMWIYLLIGRIRNKPLYTVVEERKNPLIVGVMAGVLAVGVRLLVTAYYYWALNIDFLKKSIDSASALSPQFTHTGQMLAALFAIVVIAPVFEEVLFRAIVLGELLTIMRPWAAILLQGIVFGVAHAVLFQTIFAVCVGVLLGVVYYKTRSIKSTIICHSVFNLSAMLAGEITDVRSSVIYAVFGLLLIASSLSYLVVNCKRN